MAKEKEGMLAPYRVLDLTDEKGFLCGKILADLGADVIKIEKPGGDTGRNIAPFYHDVPDPQKSLYWFAYNLNKRGISLNIETSDGRGILKGLVKTADFVIETFSPGYLDRLGLGYSSLSKINPHIIMTSITPFGQLGPYKDHNACDLTLIAMGGLLYITGYPDMPPVRISFPQSWLLAGSQAAAATMVAHYHREVTGEGQHVDVSIQSSITWVITNTVPLWELNKTNLRRQGSVIGGHAAGGTRLRTIWRCKDGFVAYALHGGQAGVSMGTPGLIEWMDDEGMADDFIKTFDWGGYDLAAASQEVQSQLEAYLERFFLTHTKLELYRGGLKRGITVYPVYSPKDIIEDSQLQERDFWVQVKHPELNVSIAYPGTFFRTNESPFRIRCRAPLTGEHNREIYAELGLSEKDIVELKQANVI